MEDFYELESLQLDYVVMEGGGRPKDVVFHRLRNLRLHATKLLEGSYLMDLVLQSPMLESLVLKIPFGGPQATIYGVIKGPTVNVDWPHLRKLNIQGGKEDADLAFIFKRVGNGPGNSVDVEPYRSGFDTQASGGFFSSHFSALVDVDLHRSMEISSSTIPDILCFCPKLETLRAGSVLARSVAERGPWVCQELRELWIQFLFDTSEHELTQLMFERVKVGST